MTDDTAAQHFGRMANQPPKMGRPSGYSKEVADRICQHIADGGYMTKLERFGLPHAATIGRWLNENEDFRAAYARAREKRAETFADQMVEIADTCEDPQRGRLQIETRKWIASKLLPRVYGENQRVEVQHTISETAARVLADLSQRQKERKALERQVIDVTPVQSPREGVPRQQDQSLAQDCTHTAPIGAVDEAGLEPPAPATTPPPAAAAATPSPRKSSRK